MKTLVIHHSADFDGIFCREIARKYFGDQAEYLGWDYRDPLPVVSPDVSEIYMLDISVDGMMDDPRLVWIDHHKSAIDKFPKTIRGHRIDGVAACRLAWQWFNNEDSPQNPFCSPVQWSLPSKVCFVERTVSEPLAVRLAGEYDIRDKRDPDAELFQHGLRSQDLTAHDWHELFSYAASDLMVEKLLKAGNVLQYAKTKENESIAKHLSFTIQFEGLCFCAINAARYNSHLFTAGIKPEHDALFGFNYDGKKWRVSLYHAPGKEHHDLSKIAVKHGGGGHKGACGFTLDKLPFIA